MRFVAKYGDACNLFERLGPAELRRKLGVLREHCEAEGRRYEEIEKTSLSHLALSRDGGDGAASPAEVVERFHALSELGFDHAIFSVRDIHEPATMELIGAELVPRVRGLAPTGR